VTRILRRFRRVIRHRGSRVSRVAFA
jgi:hypothetical protein